jgi:hypothetical protein
LFWALIKSTGLNSSRHAIIIYNSQHKNKANGRLVDTLEAFDIQSPTLPPPYPAPSEADIKWTQTACHTVSNQILFTCF